MSDMRELLVTEDEIVALTGYKRPAEQLRELLARGFFRARRGPVDKRVILERPHYEVIQAEILRKRGGVTELYRHFDAEDRLLYVGISLSTAMRMGDHRTGSHWWDKVTRITIERLPTREEAAKAELAAIKGEKPLHNLMGKERGA